MKTDLAAFTISVVSIASIFAENLEFTPAEFAEAKNQFALADKELNEVYEIAESGLSEDQFESLRDEQRDWLRSRDAIAEFAVIQNGRAGYEGREKESIHYWQDLTFRSKLRAKEIRAWIELDGVVEWTGYWTDGNGAELLIRKLPDAKTFEFSASIIFGRSLRSEGIEGTAEINEDMAFFRYESRSKDEGWVVFKKHDESPRLDLIPSSHDPGRYCGGTFTRVRDLSETERSETLRTGIFEVPVDSSRVAEGFRDAKIGMDQDSLQNLSYLRAEKIPHEFEEDRDFEFFSRSSDSLSYHDVNLKGIEYGFTAGKLECIRIHAQGLAAFEKLSQIALSKYGSEPDASPEVEHVYERAGEQFTQTLYVHYRSKEDAGGNPIGHSWMWGVPETGWRWYYLSILYDADTGEVVQELTIPAST